jgi:hypothetical protein
MKVGGGLRGEQTNGAVLSCPFIVSTRIGRTFHTTAAELDGLEEKPEQQVRQQFPTGWYVG